MSVKNSLEAKRQRRAVKEVKRKFWDGVREQGYLFPERDLKKHTEFLRLRVRGVNANAKLEFGEGAVQINEPAVVRRLIRRVARKYGGLNKYNVDGTVRKYNENLGVYS